MSAPPLLHTLFSYRAWANDELLERMEGFDAEHDKEARHAAIRLMNHCHVVDQIFAAHLVGMKHEFSSDNTADTPTLAELRATVGKLDRWYLRYLETLTPALLAERVPFVFTDGDKGFMSREEMLAHVVTHGGYHRGEIGRLMRQQSVELPWDTFAVYLHQAEPSRRLQAA